MKIRLYDLFDKSFTCGIYNDVAYCTNGIIYFSNGDEINFDCQFVGVEILDGEENDIENICDEEDAAGYVVFAEPNEIEAAGKSSIFDTQDGIYKTLQEAQERARLISGVYPYHVARYWDYIRGDYNYLD